MQFYYSDVFNIPLPEGHRFPGQKYRMLRELLIEQNIVKEHDLLLSPLADVADIKLAHCPAYVDAYMGGQLSKDAIRQIGLPWTEHLVKRSLATMGGAIAAVKSAIDTGISGQLAGGTHHAHYDFGSGYCVFNDFSIAALKALDMGWAKKVAIIDLDVHQGDGNAAILKDNPNCFVFSMHGEKNFPFRKCPSDLDIGLQDGCDDKTFCKILSENLHKVFDSKPDLILYQAGVDPLSHDKLGRLDLTFYGLMERDRIVLDECYNREIPVSMAIGGGYSDPIEYSVKAYANTYRVAKKIYGF